MLWKIEWTDHYVELYRLHAVDSVSGSVSCSSSLNTGFKYAEGSVTQRQIPQAADAVSFSSSSPPPPLTLHIHFISVLIDTLCSQLDQETKARYAIQQKLKGNLIQFQNQVRTGEPNQKKNKTKSYLLPTNMQVLLSKKKKKRKVLCGRCDVQLTRASFTLQGRVQIFTSMFPKYTLLCNCFLLFVISNQTRVTFMS